MALNVLNICTRALEERAQFNTPANFYGNSDPTAKRTLRAFERTGRSLLRLHLWQRVQQTYTFPTVASTADYALPSGFQRMIALTEWDRTNLVPLVGPMSAAAWEELRSGNLTAASVVESYFRITGDLFSIYPTPTAVHTIAYQYVTSNWLMSGAASSAPDQEYVTADTNFCIFEDDLMVSGTRERYEAIVLGVDFTPSPEYTALLNAAVSADGSKAPIDFRKGKLLGTIYGEGNIQEGNWTL